MSKKIMFFTILLLTLLVFPVSAQENFVDINENDWFYNEVQAAKKYNLINGYSDGTFKPNDFLKKSEGLKISVLSTMTLNNHNGNSWLAPYIDVGNKVGIIPLNFSKTQNEYITRHDFLQYIYYLLLYKYDTAPSQNIFEYFNDFNNEVTTFMYDAQILNGVNQEDGIYCRPFEPLTRAEAISIANRTIDYVFRVNRAPFLSPLPESPSTEEEVSFAYKYMAFNNISSMSFYYPLDVDYIAITDIFKNKYNDVRGKHYNYCQDLNTAKFSVKRSYKNIIIDIDFETTDENWPEKTLEFFNKCDEINQNLWNSQTLNLEMNQYDMALTIFAYICKNYHYAENGDDFSLGQGWKMLRDGYGVCSGYDSIFNTLCKLNGIKAIGVTSIINGEYHIYSKCLLDGQILYADPTWGDPVPDRGPDGYNADWFGLTLDEILKYGRKEGAVINEKFDIGAGFRVMETSLQLPDGEPTED